MLNSRGCERLPKWENLFYLVMILGFSRFIIAFMVVGFGLPVAGQLPNPDYYSIYQQTGAGRETVLVDSEGTVLHTWANDLLASNAAVAYLREDGLLLRSVQRGGGVPAGFLAGSFSTVQLVTWDGEVVWEFDHQVTGQYTLHHDIKPASNGNVLVTVWEFFPAAEAEALGWQPVSGVAGVWMDGVMEIAPNLTDGTSEIVWEWSIANHLIQDVDETAANFGDVSANPGKVDVNFSARILSGDYFHIAGIDYNPEREEIILCPNFIDEIWVIDRSTTIAQAATSSGGNRARGGELLYRWGNPEVYDFGGGPAEPRILERAHDVRWVLCPQGTWQATIHNNERLDEIVNDDDSQVLVLDLPIDENDDYVLEVGSTFAPEVPEVLYEFDPANPFFSSAIMGGAQVLRNGNVLITLPFGPSLVEVEPSTGEVVWRVDLPAGGFVFKAQNYPISYVGYGPSLAINYDIWRDANFGTGEPLENGPNEDADSDGFSNLLEYYAGSDPQEGRSALTLCSDAAEVNGETAFSVNFERLTNVPDVSGRIEFSRTLDPWVDVSDSLNVTETVNACIDGTEDVMWLMPIEDEERGFVRIAVDLIE